MIDHRSHPVLDVVIPVHTVERPIRRAVASVVGVTPEPRLRVTVVCHEVDVGSIDDLLADLPRERIRLLPFSDGVRSPAGPMNAGLAAATADYVAVMGSDDFFEPGAIAAYLDEVESEHPDVLIVPLRHQDGELLRNPFVRWRRRRWLDPVRDRLFYRTAPLALIRRLLLDGRAEPFLAELPSGEDLDFSTWLWTRPIRIDFPVDAPAYVIGADADDRVTLAAQSAHAAMEPLRRLLETGWVAALAPATRHALGVKLLRIHVLGALRARRHAGHWTPGDLESVVSVARAVLALAPRALEPFARAERRILETVVMAGSGLTDVLNAIELADRAAWRDRVLPADLTRALDREGTLRRFLLYRLDRWGAG